MNLEMDSRWYRDTEIPDLVKIYASRLARLYYLRQFHSSNKSVLITEQHLVEIARSKLQESLLKTFTIDEIKANRSYLVWWIKSIAKIRACSHVDDNGIQRTIESSIDREKLDELFTWTSNSPKS